MKNAQARTTYLKDYRPPDFLIETTELFFDLFEDHALVIAKLAMRRSTKEGADVNADSLTLNGGQALQLKKLLLNGKLLGATDYLIDEESLTIPDLSSHLGGDGDSFQLECHTRIEPQNNTTLEGLYKSKRMFCTQCEAEGFRHITYYLDRPDVMSRFVTTVCAEKARYPILLSNGNSIASGVSEDDPSRHWVTWEDPFLKPSYLFALVAGDLVSLDDTFTTSSGREIALRLFVEEKDLDKTAHAMDSLKRSMRWDEETYGREYDLDIFMIVAVDDFNMGAMENKGLNIFNTSCVLANPSTTTDLAFQRVEAVVAHEYFHNWSGNRVTCRDWFQLSLKEGFTVFRDSEFSADMGSRAVKRIEDVSFLRTVQFAEDAGPMAHSVRPDSYMEIANFYTVTIYEKGAEVVRMISLLLGPEKFREATDLYFERFDGQAVTTEDFVRTMEDASGVDLGQFRRWYSQAGTPRLEIKGDYNAEQQQYTLTVQQSCPATPGQPDKEPLHIPLRVGLLNTEGEELPLHLHGVDHNETAGQSDLVLNVTQRSQQFIFDDIASPPIPSLLRGFSAPVKMHFDFSLEDLFFLMVHDTDGFNRWDAAQQMAIQVLTGLEKNPASEPPQLILEAFRGVIKKSLVADDIEQAMTAQLLMLPATGTLIERADVAVVERIHGAREQLLNYLAEHLQGDFERLYEANQPSGEFEVTAAAMGVRAVKNLALGFLVRSGDATWLEACHKQFQTADNMTDQLAALRLLVNAGSAAAQPLATEALESFYKQWQHEPLVVDQWFITQACCALPGTLERVRALLEHEAFDIKNPNKVRSLIGAFCGQNHVNFHAADGGGYEFLADQALVLDKLNPQIAARLLTPLTRWRKFEPGNQALMQAQLQRIKASDKLSKDVFEVVEKSTL